MKNNQFKKLIRTKIEETCLAKNLQCVYVDSSNNDRMFYIYDMDFSIRGQMKLYLNDSYVHMYALKVFRNEHKKSISIANFDKEVKASYFRFEDVIKFIHEFLDSVKVEKQSEKDLSRN